MAKMRRATNVKLLCCPVDIKSGTPSPHNSMGGFSLYEACPESKDTSRVGR